jgi:hypothetical protein
MFSQSRVQGYCKGVTARWGLKEEAALSCLIATGSTGASTAEYIAAAFVLNKPEYLPANYTDLVEAWDRLGSEW